MFYKKILCLILLAGFLLASNSFASEMDSELLNNTSSIEVSCKIEKSSSELQKLINSKKTAEDLFKNGEIRRAIRIFLDNLKAIKSSCFIKTDKGKLLYLETLLKLGSIQNYLSNRRASLNFYNKASKFAKQCQSFSKKHLEESLYLKGKIGILKAIVYLNTKKRKKALVSLNESERIFDEYQSYSKKINTSRAMTLRLKGQSYSNLPKEVQKARESYIRAKSISTEVVNRSPKYKKAYIEKIYILLDLEKLDFEQKRVELAKANFAEAIDLSNRFIEVFSNDPEPLKARAIVLVTSSRAFQYEEDSLENSDAAIKSINAALELRPNDPFCYYLKALAYTQKGIFQSKISEEDNAIRNLMESNKVCRVAREKFPQVRFYSTIQKANKKWIILTRSKSL